MQRYTRHSHPPSPNQPGSGCGAALGGRSGYYAPAHAHLLKETAKSAGVTIQEGISRSYTDTSAIQLFDIPVATLGIPLRYAHAPAQIADINDLVQTTQFMKVIAQKAGQYLFNFNKK